MSALKAALQKEMYAATQEATEKSFQDLQTNVQLFYDSTEGRYQRTGQLGNSPATSGVSGGGSSISTEIYLDDSYSYTTGTWSTNQVLNAAEYGTANLVGSPGFWAKTVEEMSDIIENAFTSVGFTK